MNRSPSNSSPVTLANIEADGANEIAPDVIGQLVEFGLVHVVEGRPVLTAYGEKAYVVLESGDGYIPELE